MVSILFGSKSMKRTLQGVKYREISKTCEILYKKASSGGLEPPTFRLTVERANRLRHEDR